MQYVRGLRDHLTIDGQMPCHWVRPFPAIPLSEEQFILDPLFLRHEGNTLTGDPEYLQRLPTGDGKRTRATSTGARKNAIRHGVPHHEA